MSIILLFIYALAGTCATHSDSYTDSPQSDFCHALNAQQSFAVFNDTENGYTKSHDIKIQSLQNSSSLLFRLEDNVDFVRTLAIHRKQQNGMIRAQAIARIQVDLTPCGDSHVCTLSVGSRNEEDVLKSYANMTFITEAKDLACMSAPQVAMNNTNPNCATLTYNLPKSIEGHSHSLNISAVLPMLPRFIFSVERNYDGVSDSQCRLAYEKNEITPRSIAFDPAVLNAQHIYAQFDYREDEAYKYRTVQIKSAINSASLTFRSNDKGPFSRTLTIARRLSTPKDKHKPVALIQVDLTPYDDPTLHDDLTPRDDLYVCTLSVEAQNDPSVLGNYADMKFITRANDLSCMDLPKASGIYPKCTTLTYNLPKGENGYRHTLDILTHAPMLPWFMLSGNRQSDERKENQFMLAYEAEATTPTTRPFTTLTPRSITFDTAVLNAKQPLATFDYIDGEITETDLLKISPVKTGSPLAFHLDKGNGYPRRIKIFRNPLRKSIAEVMVDLTPCDTGYLCSVSLQHRNRQSMLEDDENVQFITNASDLACMHPPQVDLNATRDLTTLTYNLPKSIGGTSSSIAISAFLKHLPKFMLSIKTGNDGTARQTSLSTFVYDADERTPREVFVCDPDGWCDGPPFA